MIAVDGFAAGGVEPSEHAPDEGGGYVSTDFFDLDGDGRHETAVRTTEAGMTVGTDVDGDGVMDKFTAFDRDGHYESWEIFREANGFGEGRSSESGRL